MNLKYIIPLLLLLYSLTSAGQRVFKVEYESRADINVYVVEYETRADKKIYFVDYESQADLKIYMVKYESQAGWRNREKQHLLL